MRPAVLFLITLSPVLLTAQHEQQTPKVRSIRVNVVSTSPEGLTPTGYAAIAAAWERSHVNLAVEKPLDTASLDKAKETIREMYGREGHAVRVKHSIHSISARGVEVAFQVIELCRCN